MDDEVSANESPAGRPSSQNPTNQFRYLFHNRMTEKAFRFATTTTCISFVLWPMLALTGLGAYLILQDRVGRQYLSTSYNNTTDRETEIRDNQQTGNDIQICRLLLICFRICK